MVVEGLREEAAGEVELDREELGMGSGGCGSGRQVAALAGLVGGGKQGERGSGRIPMWDLSVAAEEEEF